MTRLVALLLVLAACAPPRAPAWYDATNDVVHYDDALLAEVAATWGQAGADWDIAHEKGHQTMMRRWRLEHVALWLLMPGATANIQIEQVAQCLASASGAVQPWVWDDETVAAGYWPCPAELVALVAAA